MAGELIRQGKYPDVTHVALGDIMRTTCTGTTSVRGQRVYQDNVYQDN